MKEMTFTAACMEFSARKRGQTSLDFMKELKELTAKDRDDLKAMFPSVGIKITG